MIYEMIMIKFRKNESGCKGRESKNQPIGSYNQGVDTNEFFT
jgi:hypothetical protein